MNAVTMDRAFLMISSFLTRKTVHDDDFVDRLHHKISVLLLLLFASSTALQEHVGDPIDCWCPAAFAKEHYKKHVNGYCWTHPLRYLPYNYDSDISGTEAQQLASKRLVNFGTAFYRWVTLVFVLQAILFKLPDVAWSHLNRQSEASLSKLRELLMDSQLESEERMTKLDEAAQYLHSWLASYRIPPPRKIFGREIGSLACLFQGCGRRSGKYLCVVYLCVKMLYLLNVIGNFIILSVFLDADFWSYGITVLSSVLGSGDWHDPVNFPRLLLCDFYLQEGAKNGEVQVRPGVTSAVGVRLYTLQCVLSINMILEKVFVLQWFWLVALAVLTLATFITWAVHAVCVCSPYLFARKFMKELMSQAKNAHTKRTTKRFVRSYLRQDGIFVLRMLEANTDPVMVKELVQHLWEKYQTRDSAFTIVPMKTDPRGPNGHVTNEDMEESDIRIDEI